MQGSRRKKELPDRNGKLGSQKDGKLRWLRGLQIGQLKYRSVLVRHFLFPLPPAVGFPLFAGKKFMERLHFPSH